MRYTKLIVTFFAAPILAVLPTYEGWAREGVDLKSTAASYVVANRPKLARASTASEKYEVLIYLAPAALFADDLDSAAIYARDLLAIVDTLRSDRIFGADRSGSAMHNGNLVLGLIATRAGDLQSAKEHLLAACSLPNSPPPSHYGPDMTLAKELLDNGERAVVIEYIELCAKTSASQSEPHDQRQAEVQLRRNKNFSWSARQRELFERWKADIEQGRTPNFGHSVGTQLWRFARTT